MEGEVQQIRRAEVVLALTVGIVHGRHFILIFILLEEYSLKAL